LLREIDLEELEGVVDLPPAVGATPDSLDLEVAEKGATPPPLVQDGSIVGLRVA